MRCLFFRDLKPDSARVKCGQRLGKLVESKRLKELRGVYYTKTPANIDETIDANWGHVWVAMRKNPWQDAGHEQGLAWLHNRVTGAYRLYLIGVGYRDAPHKYADVYAKQEYRKEWWAGKASGFPTILLIARDSEGAKHLKEQCAVVVAGGIDLDFVVRSVDELRRECLSWQSSGSSLRG